VVLHTTARKRG